MVSKVSLAASLATVAFAWATEVDSDVALIVASGCPAVTASPTVAGTDVTCPYTAKDKFAVSAGWIVPVAATVERKVRVVAVTSRVVGAAAVDRVAAHVPTAAATSKTATSPMMM